MCPYRHSIQEQSAAEFANIQLPLQVTVIFLKFSVQRLVIGQFCEGINKKMLLSRVNEIQKFFLT